MSNRVLIEAAGTPNPAARSKDDSKFAGLDDRRILGLNVGEIAETDLGASQEGIRILAIDIQNPAIPITVTTGP